MFAALRPLRSRRPLVLAGLFASLSGLGCSAISGEYDAETRFLVLPKGDGTFSGWSEITIEEDARDTDGATLSLVSLAVMEPPDTADLSFLESVAGAGVSADGHTPLVSRDGFPAGEKILTLDILYDGDLRPFFPDGHTVHVDWTGATNPAHTAWPEGGYWLQVRVKIEVD